MMYTGVAVRFATAGFNVLLRARYRRITRRYYRRWGRLPNYANPYFHSEKVQWRKLFDRNPLFPVFLDKIDVRDFVADTAPELSAPRILWTGTDPDSIPYESLPARYVIKPNCRSGDRHFVMGPADVNKEEIAAKCRQWLSRPFGRKVGEWGYLPVRRRLLIEEFLATHAEEDGVTDFRFHVFDGRVHMISSDSSRLEHATRIPLGNNTFYDRTWNQLPFIKVNRQSEIAKPLSKPTQMDSMIASAEKLGAGIDHVRVDLYLAGDRPHFGEITVYPLSGMERFEVVPGAGLRHVEPWEIYMSRPWKLPDIPLPRRLYRGVRGL
ncbi:MAG: ATP-grasp fold amidoligase family protein [Gammaproteobacteria bacterium]|nr:ATP-grasp fold amidoligase family protein [Gammaproteobacteria bacterium]